MYVLVHVVAHLKNVCSCCSFTCWSSDQLLWPVSVQSSTHVLVCWYCSELHHLCAKGQSSTIQFRCCTPYKNFGDLMSDPSRQYWVIFEINLFQMSSLRFVSIFVQNWMRGGRGKKPAVVTSGHLSEMAATSSSKRNWSVITSKATHVARVLFPHWGWVGSIVQDQKTEAGDGELTCNSTMQNHTD